MLYVIVPYFNPCGERLRELNTLKFLEYLQATKDVGIVLVDAVKKGQPELFWYNSELGFRLRVITQVNYETTIWRKENLINIGINSLPDDADCFAWVDSDITFARHDWVKATLDTLNKGIDIVQMFSQVILTRQNGEIASILGGVFSENDSITLSEGGNVLRGHPGFAWAMTKKAWEAVGRLPDKGIVGGGDTEFAYGLLGQLHRLREEKSSTHLKHLIKWASKIDYSNAYQSWIEGAIVHHWHGPEEIRGYFSRSSILMDENYNPDEDTIYNDEGLLELSPKGMRLQEKIKAYMESRVSYQGV